MARILVDVAMLISMIVLFDRKFTGGVPHEVLSIVLLVIFILHMKNNWTFFKNMRKGNYTPKRKIMTFVNVGLLVSFVVTMISGLIISKFLLQGIIPPDIAKTPIFKLAHKSVPFLMIMFIGLHLGLHWEGLWSRFKKFAHLPTGKAASLAYTGASMAIAVAGAYAFNAYRFADRLSLTKVKGIETDIVPFFLWHLSIAGLFAVLGYWIVKKA